MNGMEIWAENSVSIFQPTTSPYVHIHKLILHVRMFFIIATVLVSINCILSLLFQHREGKQFPTVSKPRMINYIFLVSFNLPISFSFYIQLF